MQRYIVHDHHRDSATLRIVGGRFHGAVALHSHLGEYHWTRLTDGHILISAHYGIPSHAHLHARSDTTVLPSQNSAKSLKDHFESKGTHAHWASLSAALNLPDNATMSHFVDAVEVLGPMFAASK